jgi:hypothetical protein
MSMLNVATKMQLQGRTKLLESRDPFGSGPFEAAEISNGIELKSKLIVDKKPVTLTVLN